MKTRSFDVKHDGEEVQRYGYRFRQSRRKVPVDGDYCKADDVEVLEQILLSYRDGHSVMGSGRECFVMEDLDQRCEMCKMVDALMGKDAHQGMLDELLANIRSKNNGLGL